MTFNAPMSLFYIFGRNRNDSQYYYYRLERRIVRVDYYVMEWPVTYYYVINVTANLKEAGENRVVHTIIIAYAACQISHCFLECDLELFLFKRYVTLISY